MIRSIVSTDGAACKRCKAPTDAAGFATFGLDADNITTADRSKVTAWICTDCFAAPEKAGVL